MPISHRRVAFLDARISCDRWLSPAGLVRWTEAWGAEQDERLFSHAVRPANVEGRGVVMIVLEGELRALVDGRTRTMTAGDVAAVGARDRLVTYGGYCTTMEIEWALAPGSLGEGRLGARALEVVRAAGAGLHDAAANDAFAPHAVALRDALAHEGITLERFAPPTASGEDPKEQRYAAALDALLSDFRDGSVTGWESASGMTRRTLTRQTHAFHQRYRLGGVANRTDWRAVRDHYRAVIGAMLLTHRDATVQRVAHAVGYGASTAFCHAFASLGLPQPGRVRALVRAA